MDEVRDRARLVDATALADRGVTATVPRSEIEDILRSDDGLPELQLNIVRRDDDVEAHTVRLDWDPAELQELLRRSEGEDVTLMFDERELESLLEDMDVEAHGIRERAVVLAVAVATAATVGASQAGAVPKLVEDSSGGGGSTPIAMISDAASSGPVAPAPTPELISDAAMSGPVAAAEPAELVSDAGLSGPRPIATPQSAELVSDAALSGPRPIATPQSAELVSDAALSGPVPTQTAELADASGTGISAPDAETTGLIVGGAALALTAAFAMRRRRSHDDAARPA
jgi:hypothetical protein